MLNSSFRRTELGRCPQDCREGDRKGNLPLGLRGLVPEAFEHLDCKKCSEMHFKLS